MRRKIDEEKFQCEQEEVDAALGRIVNLQPYESSLFAQIFGFS